MISEQWLCPGSGKARVMQVDPVQIAPHCSQLPVLVHVGVATWCTLALGLGTVAECVTWGVRQKPDKRRNCFLAAWLLVLFHAFHKSGACFLYRTLIYRAGFTLRESVCRCVSPGRFSRRNSG